MARTVRGARVLITGAAGGMGRLYAARAVREAARSVVLWDVDERALTGLRAELRRDAAEGTTVASYAVDLRELGAIAQAAHRVRRDTGDPDIVINNAGVVRGELFWEHNAGDDIRTTMQVNALAPMYIAREFLPAMIASDEREARIVNVASAAGLVSNPRMSVYAASKWAVIGWSDSLRLELEREGHGNVKVTTVAPSFVDTGMFDGARGPLLTPVMAPERVVERVWRAMIAGTPFLMLPRSVGVARALRGMLPTRAWDAVAGSVLGIYSSMDEFRGRDADG